jgi:hypothetical protein
VHIESARKLEESKDVAEEEQNACNNKLSEEEEERCLGFVEDPFVPTLT